MYMKTNYHKYQLFIYPFLFLIFFLPKNAFAWPSCGWQCSGTNAVCKAGGDETVDLGYGCPCRVWCTGNGQKTSDVPPCVGSFVSCQGQWNRNTSGCCNPPAITPTKTPTITTSITPTTTPTINISITPTPYCQINSLTCVADSTTGIKLQNITWDSNETESGLIIHSPPPHVNATNMENVYAGPFASQVIDSGLSPNTTYHYDYGCWVTRPWGKVYLAVKTISCKTNSLNLPTPTPTSFPIITVTPTPPSVTATPNSYFQVFGGNIHLLNETGNPNPPLFLSPVSTLSNPTYFQKDRENQPDSAGIFSTASNQNMALLGNLFLSVRNYQLYNYPFPSKKIYDYSYFKTNLTSAVPLSGPVSLQGNKLSPGSYNLTNNSVWKIDGNLEVDNLDNNLGVLVFMVSGTITFKQNISSSPLPFTTYPVFIANGKITINKEVEKLNGILITDDLIETEKDPQQFVLENGSLVAYNHSGSFSLQRNPTDANLPGEKFIYDPAYLIKLEKVLGETVTHWQEVGPN